MILIGVTGGVGMGKSTAARLLADEGLAIADTDHIARQVVEPGQPALEDIRRQFGEAVIGPDGRLLRSELGRLVFADKPARQALEAILHPRIRQQWLSAVEEWRSRGLASGAVIVPLLFETHCEDRFDAIACVACSAPAQRTRLLDRGWTIEDINGRIAAQWPIEQKMLLANFLVWTEGSLSIHAQQWNRILARLR